MRAWWAGSELFGPGMPCVFYFLQVLTGSIRQFTLAGPRGKARARTLGVTLATTPATTPTTTGATTISAAMTTTTLGAARAIGATGRRIGTTGGATSVASTSGAIATGAGTDGRRATSARGRTTTGPAATPRPAPPRTSSGSGRPRQRLGIDCVCLQVFFSLPLGSCDRTTGSLKISTKWQGWWYVRVRTGRGP